MTRSDVLARQAAKAALQFRQVHGYERTAPICPIDAAEKAGLQVWIMPLPSLEGMYCKDRGPSIVISSERPLGRQNFTTGHELGHHVFGHGTRSDEYLESPRYNASSDPEEFLANVFSSHLLMPAAAIREAFAMRELVISRATPPQFYSISSWLGVGYETLIGHMADALRILSSDQATALRRESPKSIRKALVGDFETAHLIVADRHWRHRTIDLRIGDAVVLPEDTIVEGEQLSLMRATPSGRLTVATCRGIGRVESPTYRWNSFVRVMPDKYEGLARFRFDEVPDEN